MTDTNKISKSIERLRGILNNYDRDFCDLALNMIDAMQHDQLDIDKLIGFPEADFLHDINILVNWDRQLHRCMDQPVVLRSSKDPESVKHTHCNHYTCSECGTEWSESWNCACNDRCPKCGIEIEPYASEESE